MSKNICPICHSRVKPRHMNHHKNGCMGGNKKVQDAYKATKSQTGEDWVNRVKQK